MPLNLMPFKSMPFKSMPFKRISAGVLICSASVLLTGCNNDSKQNDSKQNASQPAANLDDAFVAQVRLQTDSADALSETTEPVEVMQINETAPEQTEPQAVTF